MTKEQIKQKAEEYANGKADKGNYDYAVGDHVYFGMSALERAYIAGAIENGIQWHDLRKNPNDFPKSNNEVIVYMWESYYIGYFNLNMWHFEDFSEESDQPVAWCDMPKFFKEETK